MDNIPFTGEDFDDEAVVEVFTDGVCINNGKPGAIGGLGVFWGLNHEDNESKRLDGIPTNMRAAIHAAIIAIEQAKNRGIHNLILHTDSENLIKGITKWINKWLINGWIKATGDPVQNQGDYRLLNAALQGINIQWVHVPGNQQNHPEPLPAGHIEANKLATQATE